MKNKTESLAPLPWQELTKQDIDLLPIENEATLKGIEGDMTVVGIGKRGGIIIENKAGVQFEKFPDGSFTRLNDL